MHLACTTVLKRYKSRDLKSVFSLSLFHALKDIPVLLHVMNESCSLALHSFHNLQRIYTEAKEIYDHSKVDNCWYLQVYDEDLEKLEPHFRFYYDCLMLPNSRSVLTALKRVSNMEFGIIAVGHGPLLRYNVEELVHRYETWSKQAQEKQLTSVAVLYVSDYGYSDRLSQVRIAEQSQHHLIWIRCHDWN